MRARNKLIEELKTQLESDKLYSSKDRLLLALLDNALTLYTSSMKKVKKEGAVTTYLDMNGSERERINPQYTVALELSKEILKQLNQLYLTPASRQLLKAVPNKDDDPFTKLVEEMNEMDVETR